MKPQSLEIRQLVGMYLSDELKLPEMQRKYVWTSPKVRDLIDSIYRDYPSGSILMWKQEILPETRQTAIQTDRDKSVFSEKLLLLDGQQRITSLASVMTGRPIRVREGDQIAERHIELYFNLEHPDKIPVEVVDPNSGHVSSEDEDYKVLVFQVKNKSIENVPHWISVTKLFKEGVGSVLKDLKVGWDHPSHDKYNTRLNQLYNRRENYVYPVQILPKELSYQEATDVFVRVNSLGSRLGGSDLALALVTSRWPGLIKLFETFLTHLAKSNFFLNEGLLIRCVMAVATGQSRFDGIGKIPIDDVKRAWEESKKGLELVVNFVRNNARLDTSGIVSSPFAFIPLLLYAIRNDYSFAGRERQLLHWFYAASMWGHYGRGSSETILDTDLSVLNSQDPGESLLRNLTQQIGRIEVKEEDLEGKNVNSSFFMMQYVLAVRNSAKDWGSGLAMSFTSIGKGHKVTYDHIFPRAKLTKLLQEKYPDDKAKVTSLVNDMANIAFLSEKENPKKSERLPHNYLRQIRDRLGEEALTSQLIPMDENLWHMERFEVFLAARRKLLVESINELLEGVIRGSVLAKPSTIELIEKGESNSLELKSSLRWDYSKNSVNSGLGLAVAKDISSFMNASGGTVLVGVDNNGRVLGLKNDFLTFERDKQNTDGFELHFMQVMRNYLGIEALQYFHVEFETVQDKIIAKIEVSPSQLPVYVKADGKTDFYVRMGNASNPLGIDEIFRYVKSHWSKETFFSQLEPT
jgi:hypothetical protein